ncbi:MAG: NUDIX hydrolase [Lachnospiraceae bacterium]
MELWDVYDKNRNKTGKTHVRGVSMAEGEYHIVTDIWTINLEGKILLTKRHPDKTFGLWWECTGGSALAGESSLESVLRELSEEVGIFADPGDVHLIHSIMRPDRFVDTYVTVQDVTGADLRLQKEEVVDAVFATFEEVCSLWEQGKMLPRERFPMYRDLLFREVNQVLMKTNTEKKE